MIKKQKKCIVLTVLITFLCSILETTSPQLALACKYAPERGSHKGDWNPNNAWWSHALAPDDMEEEEGDWDSDDKYKHDIDPCDDGNDPVDFTSGALQYSQTLFSLKGRGGLDLKLVINYTSQRNIFDSLVGNGWYLSYMTHALCTVPVTGGTNVKICGDGGVIEEYEDNGDDTYNPPPGRFSTLTKVDSNNYELKEKDGTIYKYYLPFPAAGVVATGGRLIKIVDRNGNEINFTYENWTFHSKLQKITDTTGREIDFTYQGPHLTTIEGPQEGSNRREFTFNYLGNNLSEIVRPDLTSCSFEYDIKNRMVKRYDPNDNKFEYTYTSLGRVATVKNPQNIITELDYHPSENYTRAEDNLGNWFCYHYDEAGKITKIVDPLLNETNYTYDADRNMSSSTDANGNVTQYTYDVYGNLLTETKVTASGNITTTYDYESTYNQVSKITDPLGRVTDFLYDANGNLTEVKKTIGGQVVSKTYTYDTTSPAGQGFGNRLSEIDENGKETTFGYDIDLKFYMTDIYDALNNHTILSYEAYGNVSFTTDPGGYSTSYEYDDMLRVMKITYPDTTNEEFTYDDNGNKTTSIDRRSKTTQYTYSSRDRLTEINYPGNNGTTEYIYDGVGNKIGEIDPRSIGITYEYDSAYRMTKMVHQSDGTYVQYTYDGTDNILTVRDENGNITKNQYDQLNRLAKVIFPDDTFGDESDNPYSAFVYNDAGLKIKERDPMGATTEFSYDDTDRLSTVIYPDSTTESYTYDKVGNKLTFNDRCGKTTTYTYDDVNRLKTVTDPLLNKTIYYYDSRGNVTNIEIRDSQNTLVFEEQKTYDSMNRVVTVTDGCDRVTSYEYDDNGNLEKVTLSGNRVTEYVYDDLNRKTKTRRYIDDTNYYETVLQYDNNSNLTKITDPEGNWKQFVYDNRDQLEQVKQEMTGEVFATDYSYDSVGNMTMEKDYRQIACTYDYDNRYNLEKAYYPLGCSVEYFYDAKNRLIEKTDPNGNTISYSYDTMDRITSIAFPDTSTRSYTYDNSGNVLTVTDSVGTITYSYDNAGRVSSVTDVHGKTNTFQYDGARRMTQVTRPECTIQYTYYGDGQVNQIIHSVLGTVTYTYDDAGRRASVTRPNGVKTEYTYNKLDLVMEIAHKKSDSTLIKSFSYTFDQAGNRKNMTENPGNEVTSYSYDPWYRLTYMSYPDETTESFTYDEAGNRLTRSDGTNIVNYTYNALNQLTAESVLNGATVEYSYDKAGNLTGGFSGTEYNYDYENRLTKVTLPDSLEDVTPPAISITGVADGDHFENPPVTPQITVTDADGATNEVTYMYDANGNRVLKQAIDETRKYSYVNEDVVAEYDGMNSLDSQFLHGIGIDEPLAINTDGTTSYYLQDSLGSVKALTDGTQEIAEEYDYDAWGNLEDYDPNVDNPYLFTGRRWDDETHLYYYRARYYNAFLAQFNTVDPHPKDFQNPITLNMYAYVENNPVNMIDPWGRMGIPSEFYQAFTTELARKTAVNIAKLKTVQRTIKGKVKRDLENNIMHHDFEELLPGGKWKIRIGKEMFCLDRLLRELLAPMFTNMFASLGMSGYHSYTKGEKYAEYYYILQELIESEKSFEKIGNMYFFHEYGLNQQDWGLGTLARTGGYRSPQHILSPKPIRDRVEEYENNTLKKYGYAIAATLVWGVQNASDIKSFIEVRGHPTKYTLVTIDKALISIEIPRVMKYQKMLKKALEEYNK